MRSKLIRWKLHGSSGLLGRRAIINFELLARWVPPRVRVAYFKTIWNGWTTTRRFNSLADQPNVCLFGCKYGEDSVEHYSCCEVFWKCACAPRPTGLGIRQDLRSKLGFLLLHPEMTEHERIRLAIGVYAMFRLVNHTRHNEADASFQYLRYFSIMCKRGAEGSQASKLLS